MYIIYIYIYVVITIIVFVIAIISTIVFWYYNYYNKKNLIGIMIVDSHLPDVELETRRLRWLFPLQDRARRQGEGLDGHRACCGSI